MPSIGISDFVRRQTPESSYSHFGGTWEELVAIVSANFDKAAEGYKPGVKLVPIPFATLSDYTDKEFYSSTIRVNPHTTLVPKFAWRREAEAPFIHVRAKGSKEVASYGFVVLYSHAVLMEGGEATTECDWEIISINVRTTETEEPMDPMTMARNFLRLPGGTKGEFSAQQFAESIVYWSQRALVEEIKTVAIHPDWNHIMVQEYVAACKALRFTEYDGWARYATDKVMTELLARPEDVVCGDINTNYTHVVWFHKCSQDPFPEQENEQ